MKLQLNGMTQQQYIDTLTALHLRDMAMIHQSNFVRGLVDKVKPEHLVDLMCREDYPTQKRVRDGAIEAIGRHVETCDNPKCQMESIVDAIIFATFCTPWEIARYADADANAFDNIRANVIPWRNLRSVNS